MHDLLKNMFIGSSISIHRLLSYKHQMVELLKQKEYVIASKSFRIGADYIEHRSVGLIREITNDKLKVYYVGISKIVFVLMKKTLNVSI